MVPILGIVNAYATTFTVTFEAGSSILPAGTSFPPESSIPSTTNNPVGLWYGQSVYFQGGYRDGYEANKDSFSNHFSEGFSPFSNGFMYRYRIDFSNVVQLANLRIEGDTFYAPSTWQDNLLFYDINKNILASAFTGYNDEGYRTIILDLTGIVGKTFYLEEYDVAGVSNLRTNYAIAFTDAQPIPEPSTILLLFSGILSLGGIKVIKSWVAPKGLWGLKAVNL